MTGAGHGRSWPPTQPVPSAGVGSSQPLCLRFILRLWVHCLEHRRHERHDRCQARELLPDTGLGSWNVSSSGNFVPEMLSLG